MDDLLDKSPYTQTDQPSDAATKAIAEIQEINKRREKYYKNKREIP